MDVIIRPARVEDAQAIWELNSQSLGYDYPPEKTRERLRAVLANPHNRVMLACDASGRVQGYVHTADYDCTYSDSLKNILTLAVRVDAQGQGVGRELLRAVEGWARECGCTGVRLVSGFDRTGAHQFYYHCGYSLRKEEKNFIKRFALDDEGQTGR